MVREFPSRGTFKANVGATRSKNTAKEQSSPKLEESRDFSPGEKMPNEGEQTVTSYSAHIILTVQREFLQLRTSAVTYMD